jgi:hypothetical protein
LIISIVLPKTYDYFNRKLGASGSIATIVGNLPAKGGE